MSKEFYYNFSKINYTITGTGYPVVLLHGFAEDSNIWNEQIAYLQNHCLLIISDLPGSGKSDLINKENVTIDDYASCMYALLENEKIDRCIMLGHSMGGYITLAFAEKFPEKLTAFGLVHSTAFSDSEEKKITRRKSIKFIEEHGVSSFLKNTIPNLFGKKYKEDQAEKISELIAQGKIFGKEALIQYYNAMILRPDRTVVLKESKVPVLFIIGSEDVAAPVADLLMQVHLPSVSLINIMDTVGHMSMMENPYELNKQLLQFIQFSEDRQIVIL